jgi:5-formaminoimidazole-4-carboxamide-1-beta-D-ribofuranosyl 5'-monophosphate synthetase
MNLTSGILLAGILTLSGCSSIKQLDIFSLDFEREPLALEKPTIQELEKLKWIIITSENADEVFKKMKEQGLDPVIFGLSDNDFKLLAKNFAQIRAHMMKLNVMIDEYKDYYESDVINKDKEKQEVIK